MYQPSENLLMLQGRADQGNDRGGALLRLSYDRLAAERQQEHGAADLPAQGLAPSRQHPADAPAGPWVCKRAVGLRPRIQAVPSVATAPNERWSTELARVWTGKDVWASLAPVIDCHTHTLLGWHLSRSGKATHAIAAMEHALIARSGTLGRVETEFLPRSDNGLVFSSRHFTATVRSYGLKQEFIMPHCPQQNGMIERVIRTFNEQCAHRHRFESMPRKQPASSPTGSASTTPAALIRLLPCARLPRHSDERLYLSSFRRVDIHERSALLFAIVSESVCRLIQTVSRGSTPQYRQRTRRQRWERRPHFARLMAEILSVCGAKCA